MKRSGDKLRVIDERNGCVLVGRQTRMARVGLGLLVLVSPWFATGCYDRQELEEQAFVTTLGIDKAPGNLIDCTFRIALPKNPSSGGGGSGKTPLAGSGPVSVRAHTITEALLLANSSVERTMSLTHLSIIVFSEDLAKEGLVEQLQTMVRYREFRPTVLVAVCKGSAREVLAGDKPVLEQSPSRMADSIALVGQRTGLIPIQYLHTFTTNIETQHSSVMLPKFSLNKSVQEDPKGKEGIQSKDVGYQAGEVRRSGGNPLEWMGAVILKGDKLAGELDGRDMVRLRLLQGKLKDTKLDLKDPSGNGYISLSLKKERRPTYHIQLSNPVNVQIDVPMDAEMLTIQSGIDYTDPSARRKLEKQLNQQLSEQLEALLKRTANQMDVDVIPLADHVRRQFARHSEYASFPWEKQLKTMQFKVNVDMHIRRFGVQLSPIKDRT